VFLTGLDIFSAPGYGGVKLIGNRKGHEQRGDQVKERNVQKFSELMRGNELIVAPVALNPIMARLALSYIT
jgi:hypothetical protein